MLRAVFDIVFPAQCAACGALGAGLCAPCLAQSTRISTNAGSVSVDALGAYAGALRRAILALKDGRRDVAESLGSALGAEVPRGAVLVPVPTTARRRRARGIDGAVLLAQAAARRSGARVLVALDQRAGDTQRGRSRAQRLAARGRFRCGPSMCGAAVMLVDDVCTTGATIEDCAFAVRSAGGEVAGALVVAIANRDGPWEQKAG